MMKTLFAVVALAFLGLASASFAADNICANGAPNIEQAIKANKVNAGNVPLAILQITGKAQVLEVRQLIADEAGADIATVNYGSFVIFDRPDASSSYMIAFDLEGCGAKAAPITKEQFAKIVEALQEKPEVSEGQDDKGI